MRNKHLFGFIYFSHKEFIVFTEKDKSMHNTIKNSEGADERNCHMLRYGEVILAYT